jgi:DNA invertase Pin-like site-specific DNA recombinase
MGTGARSSSPDLFSSAPAREAHSQSSEPIGSPDPVPSRHVLPADLANAVRHLNDQELEQLLSAVIAEQKRRGKKLPTEISRKPRVEVVAAAPLAQGKLNAVRAAFKAGVTPSRIARQFGISQSDVRKALASEIAKR